MPELLDVCVVCSIVQHLLNLYRGIRSVLPVRLIVWLQQL
jgi:hypothetical protein